MGRSSERKSEGAMGLRLQHSPASCSSALVVTLAVFCIPIKTANQLLHKIHSSVVVTQNKRMEKGIWPTQYRQQLPWFIFWREAARVDAAITHAKEYG